MLSRFYKSLRKIWSIPTLRARIAYTLGMFLIVRAGVHIPLPGVDLYKLRSIAQGGFIDFINLVSGGALSRASVFTLSIMPYINASIMVYVLTLMYPKLEEMRKEGGKEAERLTQWTRYLALGISIVHSVLAVFFLQSRGLVENPGAGFIFRSVLILTASVTFLTWIGDQITVNGIGNGISLIIFLGIVSRIPASAIQLFRSASSSNLLMFETIGIALLSALLIFSIVAFQIAVRKVPILYASGKGRSVTTTSYLPIRINNSGVMPIIFASVIANIPSTLIGFLPDSWSIKSTLSPLFGGSSALFVVIYFFSILFFTFFYTAVVFDPEKIADNLRKSGATFPGVRPGKETSSFLEGIITRITLGGALFLAIIAILPYLLTALLGSSFNIGGTGIIIAVGVAIETIQQIEGALSMEEYHGFI